MKTITRILLLAWIGCAGLPLAADDTDIFLSGPTAEPNVVILFDNSGSMNDRIDGEKKIDIAKRVVTGILSRVTGVRFGVMTFNNSSDGGLMVAPIGSAIDMTAAVNGLNANGNTPLGQASLDVQRYYRGEFRDPQSPRRWGWGDDDDDDDDDDDNPPYASPIQYECQLNFMILVTDGLPTGEPESLVSQTATSLYTEDHSTTLAGTQNVIVHTVGFDVPEGAALLAQTASNGGGNFYTASDAASLEQALADALGSITQQAYSFAAPLVPSTGTSSANAGYLATFRPDVSRPFWKGYLGAYRLNSYGRVSVDADGLPLASDLLWEAGQLLAAKAASSRTIYTVVSGSRVAFTNAAVTRTLLNVSTNTERDRVIDFIRGVDSYDHDADGNTTEQRDWKLGDIFHSNPALVFPPPMRSTDASYNAFKAANATRTNIVLVGANDGMLHAFRASDGQELWAFIPPDLLDDLSLLTPRSGSHPYYVDSSPIVADVKLNGTWKTVALFGERRGGRNYIALDITDTTNPLYLWSYTDTEMGETWSEPAIGRIRMSDSTVKYVAFVGGGYNTASNNTTGRAFFVIDLYTGTKLWKYAYASTGDARYINFSVAASPAIADIDGDGYTDRAYIGDVGGQLWKFDVSPLATTSSGVVTNWTGKRLFTASPSQTNPPSPGAYNPAQAFYATPVLAQDQSNNLWVFIGTGDRNRPNSTSSNRFYGIKDNTNMTNGSPLSESSLLIATSNSAVTQGWYLPLASNEKVLAAGNVFYGIAYFSTYTPGTTSVCVDRNGTAQLYGVAMTTGHAGLNWSTGQTLPSADGSVDRSVDAGGGAPSKPGVVLGSTENTLVVGTTDGEVSNTPLASEPRKRMRYWREVF